MTGRCTSFLSSSSRLQGPTGNSFEGGAPASPTSSFRRLRPKNIPRSVHYTVVEGLQEFQRGGQTRWLLAGCSTYSSSTAIQYIHALSITLFARTSRERIDLPPRCLTARPFPRLSPLCFHLLPRLRGVERTHPYAVRPPPLPVILQNPTKRRNSLATPLQEINHLARESKSCTSAHPNTTQQQQRPVATRPVREGNIDSERQHPTVPLLYCLLVVSVAFAAHWRALLTQPNQHLYYRNFKTCKCTSRHLRFGSNRNRLYKTVLYCRCFYTSSFSTPRSL